MAKLFVGQIPSVCDETYIRNLFGQFGMVQEVFILRDKATGKHKGAAFVTLADPTGAQYAIQMLDQRHTIPPQTNALQVRYAETKVQSPQASTYGTMSYGQPTMNYASPALGVPPFKKPQQNFGGRKLFVGQIPRAMTEQELMAMMAPYGVVQECIILRDKATNEGKGAAFVIFSAAAEAARAIKGLHNQTTLPPLKNPVQVKYAEGESAPPNGEPKLFVGMVSKTASEQEIQELFSAYGTVENVYIIMKQGQHTGACFVKYESLEACDAAIQNLDGKYTMPGAPKPISVKYAASPADKSVQAAFSQAAPIAAALAQLQQYGMGQYGGFNLAQQLLQLQQLQGMQFPQMQQAQPYQQMVPQPKQSAGPAGANLYVTHLPLEYTDDYLRQMFEPYGPLMSAKVYCDKLTGQSKGFGFVSFASPMSAQSAIAALNGFQIGSQRLSVQLKTERTKPY